MTYGDSIQPPRRSKLGEIGPTHKPIYEILWSSIRKLVVGSKIKKYSECKPKLHSRSLAPHDIHRFRDICTVKEHNSIIHGKQHAFFESPSCSSPHGRQIPAVSARMEKPRVAEDTQPPRGRTKRYQVTPQEAVSTKKDPWILRNRQTQSAAEGVTEVTRQREVQLDSTPPKGLSKDQADDGAARKRLTEGTRGEALNQEENDEEIQPQGNSFEQFVQGVWDNSDRVSFGMKFTRSLFGFNSNSVTKNRKRPFFTVWVTFVQAIIFFVIIGTYGVAPIGIGQKQVTAQVLRTDLSVQKVSYGVQRNLWIGPSQENLIHVGVRYSPCMRPDKKIDAALLKDRQAENDTGCCVNNDGSGCVQTARGLCAQALSSWVNWSQSSPGPNNRTSGAVCGQDPRYCSNPASVGAHTWPDDITAWPTCIQSGNASVSSKDYNMLCQIVGRPCCIGIQAECVMATREYCSFRGGYFHENATLCSQVSCMGEICGMISFTNSTKPNQFYRFFTSLFIHPGLLSLAMTMLFQWVMQYSLEREIGSLEMIILYLGCGVCGSITSSLFMPYYVSAGPDGSQFGVLAALTIEIIRWNVDERPHIQLILLFVIAFLLFAVGVIVPQVDNWAHLSGYLLGIIIALGFNPIKPAKIKYSFCFDVTMVVMRIICSVVAIFIVIILFVIFYVGDYTVDCVSCMYFNCIPFTSDYCAGMSINITRG